MFSIGAAILAAILGLIGSITTAFGIRNGVIEYKAARRKVKEYERRVMDECVMDRLDAVTSLKPSRQRPSDPYLSPFENWYADYDWEDD